MSLQDLQEHIRKGGKDVLKKAQEARNSMRRAALGAAVTMAVASPSLAAENTQPLQDTEMKIEGLEIPQPETKKDTIDFYGIPIIQEKVENTVINEINGITVFDHDLDKKKIEKDWKRGQKELFENAEPDRVDTVSFQQMADGVGAYYDLYDKNITSRYVKTDGLDRDKIEEIYLKKNPHLSEEEARKCVHTAFSNIDELNNPNSLMTQSIRAHEEQHRTNDKLGIYAPGLSPEQYALINQYDEVAANVAELNCIITGYKKQLASGVSKEEALKVFDGALDGKLGFYKDALAKGLDPDSKEGKKLMVQGTMKMWQENYQELYDSQMTGVGREAVGESDLASTVLGNDEEFQKRVKKIFDNIGNNDYNRDNKIRPLGNLSEYLPEKPMELRPIVKENIAQKVKEETGFGPEAREHLDNSIEGKKDKDKIKFMLKVLTGRAKKKEYTSSSSPKDKQQNKGFDMAQAVQNKQNQQTY